MEVERNKANQKQTQPKIFSYPSLQEAITKNHLITDKSFVTHCLRRPYLVF